MRPIRSLLLSAQAMVEAVAGVSDIKTKTKTFYICNIAWDHELGETDVMFWKTQADLETEHPPDQYCGTMKVTLTAEWVEGTKLE